MKFVILAQDKWENLSPSEKAAYLKKHPNSKYGKRKKKKVGAAAAKPKSKSKPKPESQSEKPPTEQEPKPVAIDYEKSAPPILLLDDESAKLAENAIEQELEKPEVQEALSFLTKVKKSYMGKLEEDREDTLNKAKLVSAGITMLISLALVAALPDLAPSIHSLGTLAGATIWDVIDSYDEDTKKKASDDDEEPEIEFDSRVDEQFNNEQRRNLYATLNMNASGEFKDEQFRDAVAEKFIKRNGVVT